MANQELYDHRKSSMRGLVYSTQNNGKIRIIEYISTFKINVEFLDTGYTTYTTFYQLMRGQVRDKSTNRLNQNKYCSVGYLGNGGYTPHKFPRAYKLWRSMITRCYCQKFTQTHPTYMDCHVVLEWHNFQNFCDWYINKKKCVDCQLDKDIRIKHNKVYGPETCSLVPKSINYLFPNAKSRRGKYPVGVRIIRSTGKYEASCNNGTGKQQYLGVFDSVEDAFMEYKKIKEKRIKQMAQIHKENLDIQTFDSLMNYQVEISD